MKINSWVAIATLLLVPSIYGEDKKAKYDSQELTSVPVIPIAEQGMALKQYIGKIVTLKFTHRTNKKPVMHGDNMLVEVKDDSEFKKSVRAKENTMILTVPPEGQAWANNLPMEAKTKYDVQKAFVRVVSPTQAEVLGLGQKFIDGRMQLIWDPPSQ